jgi:hypothetical protein
MLHVLHAKEQSMKAGASGSTKRRKSVNGTEETIPNNPDRCATDKLNYIGCP